MDSNNNMHLGRMILLQKVSLRQYSGSRDEALTDRPALSLKMV